MNDCSCIYVCEQEGPEVFSAREPKARKAHVCCECGRIIQPGERYEYVWGIWEGEKSEFKTCADCLSVRKAFFCEYWTFGDVWRRVKEHFAEGASLTQECVDQLSPTAEKKLRVVVDTVGLRGL